MTAQSAIINDPGQHGLFIIISVKNDTSLSSIKERIKSFNGLVNDIKTQYNDNTINASLSFGIDMCKAVFGKAPRNLQAFSAINGIKSAPATGGDLLIHLNGERFDLLYELAMRFINPIRSLVDIIEETHTFTYLDSRDLTGFIDGTENPNTDQAAGVALLADDADFVDGSFVLTQRYEHQLSRWDSLEQSTQESIIGRTKEDSIELEGADKPSTAHISRTVIKEDGEELEIVRRSQPYATITGASGLFFIAYSKDISIFDKMLASMFGNNPDGLYDHILDYSLPVTGAYFFAPAKNMLESV